MYKVILIDDEPLAQDLVAEYLSEFGEFEIVDRCLDGFAGIKSIKEHQPDLIFLDVQMPRLTGFEMLELLEDKPAVIFSTAFDEYALKAFEANAVDYLLKPFSEERFKQAVEKFLQRPDLAKEASQKFSEPELNPTQERLVFKDGARIRIIPYTELLRLEADGDYVQVYSTQGHFAKKKTLSYYEKVLPKKHFLRVHRSHIINLAQIERIDPYGKNDHQARLKDDTRIPISRNGFLELKEILGL